MKLILDVENTVTKKNGKMHLDPFEPTNKLVMVGIRDDHANTYIYDMAESSSNIQEMLDKAN